MRRAGIAVVVFGLLAMPGGAQAQCTGPCEYEVCGAIHPALTFIEGRTNGDGQSIRVDEVLHRGPGSDFRPGTRAVLAADELPGRRVVAFVTDEGMVRSYFEIDDDGRITCDGAGNYGPGFTPESLGAVLQEDPDGCYAATNLTEEDLECNDTGTSDDGCAVSVTERPGWGAPLAAVMGGLVLGRRRRRSGRG